MRFARAPSCSRGPSTITRGPTFNTVSASGGGERGVPGVRTARLPVVAVSELADSSVNIVVRPFCTPANYWDVYFATVEGSKKCLDAAKIGIPFPQRDVHLYEKKA